MLTYDDQTKARFSLSLDGRGARGEGVLATLLLGCLALLAAPQAAAQCTPTPTGTPLAPAPAAGTVECQPGDYADGINYDSLGDLTLEVPDDSVDLRLLDNGVSVTGNGADNIFWDSSAFVSGEIVGDADLGTFDSAVLDYLSGAGNVDIQVGGDIKGMDSASHAIRAESTGGGDVSVTTFGDVNRRAGFSDPDPSGIGIEALTTTGNISIDAAGQVHSGRAGSLYAIHAASSAGGNIEITAGDGVIGQSSGGSGASHAILAETTGTGNITLNTTGTVSARADDAVSVELITGGGDIDVTATGVIGDRSNTNTKLSGLFAETSGNGTIVLDVTEADIRQSGSDGIGIQAVAENGDILIDAGVNNGRLGGTAIVTHTNGTATMNVAGDISGTGSFNVTTAIRSTGNNAIVNVIGPTDLSPSLGEVNSRISDGVVISAPFDFSGLSGGAEVNFEPGSTWILTDSVSPDGLPNSQFSPADDTVSVAAGAMFVTPSGGTGGGSLTQPLPVEQDRFTVDFGDGHNVLNNAGTIAVGTRRVVGSSRPNDNAEMRLENLAEFNNSGTIWFGAGITGGGVFLSRQGDLDISGGDLWPDDILTLPGAHFQGQVDGDGNALGRIIVDIDLGRVGQTGCGAEFRTGENNGDLPVSDCIDLRGGSAGGRTEVVLLEMIPGDRGAYNPEGSVLVDLTGGDIGATDPAAFVISPDSAGYTDSIGSGAIDKGLFFYTIALDPEDEQFKLYGLPGFSVQQAPLLSQAANGLWRTATGAWFDRRVDQRDVRADSGIGSGAWVRVSRESGDRDLFTPIVGGGETFVFDNSYTQDDTAVTIGGDLISRSSGDAAWLVGGMLGYARSELDYDDSRNSAKLRGMHAGLYTSLTWNAFYLDAAVNHTWLDVYNDVPALELQPPGTVLDTEADSLGGQVEAGWRLDLGRLSVEPIAGFTYVKSELDGGVIPADDPTRLGGEVTFKEATSQRGSLGVRLRLDDVAPGIVPMSVGLTARGIEEFDGESKVVVDNIGPQDALSTDTFDGTFVNVAGDVSITNAAKTVAGFVKVDGTFHDDYDSVGVSAGLRYQW